MCFTRGNQNLEHPFAKSISLYPRSVYISFYINDLFEICQVIVVFLHQLLHDYIN